MIYEFTNGREKKRVSAPNYIAALTQLAEQEKCDPNQLLFPWHLVREEEETRYHPLNKEATDEKTAQEASNKAGEREI